MTVKEFVKSCTQLVVKYGPAVLDADIIVWNPNTKSLDDAEDICINGGAIQFNIPEETDEE